MSVDVDCKGTDSISLAQIEAEAEALADELISAAKPERGDIFVAGVSSSEIMAHKIGTYSNAEVGKSVFAGLFRACKRAGLFLAAQCCEHLNRALIVDKDCMKSYGLVRVNVVPQLKAGGSFATAAYKGFKEPVAVMSLEGSAALGMDIGGTLIGMHLRQVAVPVRLNKSALGAAAVVCARTRPPFAGGGRAVYDEELM